MDSECAVKVIIVFLVVIVIMWFMFPHKYLSPEHFDVTGTAFNDTGTNRYDMRGALLGRECAMKTYIRPDRQIRLNLYGSDMYESNYTPIEEGKKNCRKVPCPNADGYDNNDTCWTCGSLAHDKMYIPDIWPHVKN